MTDTLKDIPNMTEDELRIHLNELRDARKKGYEVSVHKVRRETNPFANVDPKVLEQVLAELKRRKGEQK